MEIQFARIAWSLFLHENTRAHTDGRSVPRWKPLGINEKDEIFRNSIRKFIVVFDDIRDHGLCSSRSEWYDER